MFLSRTVKLFKVTLDGELQEYKYNKIERKKINITSEKIKNKFDLVEYITQRDQIKIDVSQYKSAVLREDKHRMVYLDVKKSNIETTKIVIDPKKISDFIALLVNSPFPIVLTVIKSTLTNNVMEESKELLSRVHTVIV